MINTHLIYQLEDSWNKLQKMKLEYGTMRNKIETIQQINDVSRNQMSERFNLVVQKFNDENSNIQRNTEILISKLESDVRKVKAESEYITQKVK